MGANHKVLVVGGGVAGLASAAALASRGVSVQVLEQEPLCGQHATGRNAAIFRQVEHSHASSALALRSDALLTTLGAGQPPLIRRCGAIYLAAPDVLAIQQAVASRLKVQTHLLPPDALALRLGPHAALHQGDGALWGLEVPRDGVLDVHALLAAVLKVIRESGSTVTTAVAVKRLVVQHDVVNGVELVDGTVLHADAVVVAAGAWASELAQRSGLTMPITPLRRHLAHLQPATAVRGATLPVLWRIDQDEVYLRQESQGWLCSPCDEDIQPAGTPEANPDILARLAEKLERLGPGFSAAGVRRSWACLRSFAPDRSLVVGMDPAVAGLGWVVGLGGRGMSAGMGAGELLADLLLGAAPTVDAATVTALSPARLWPAAPPPATLAGARTC